MPGKPRCTFGGCRKFITPIVGDCSSCVGVFCSNHRGLEQHHCTGLDKQKQEDKKRNEDRLKADATQSDRGLHSL